jgi:hypothetical protein
MAVRPDAAHCINEEVNRGEVESPSLINCGTRCAPLQ